jgi:hypothetical protein
LSARDAREARVVYALKVPVEAIHLSAFQDSLVQSRAREALAGDELHAIGRLGAIVIDFPYFDRFPVGVMRHFLKLPTAVSDWGEALHHGRPVLVAKSMLACARVLRAEPSTRAQGARVLALALGFVSHLAVDASLHPLVNRLARARAQRLNDYPLRQHSEVEKFQSVLFHEARLGFDFMGRRELREYITVPAHAVHQDAALRDAFCAGLRDAIGRAPAPALLRRWAGGYTQYVWLVSSPAGKTLVPERVKREVREEVFSGAWGSFEAAYALAVESSREAMERALDLAQDSTREAAFEAATPVGAIDDMSAAETRAAQA